MSRNHANTHPADQPTDADTQLAIVGVSAFEERAYRVLLARADAAPAELAAELNCPPGRADRAVEQLRSLGLVTRMSGRRRRYTAVEPDSAVEALVRGKAVELERVRSTAVALTSLFHGVQRPHSRGGTVEILVGPAELARWFVRLQHQVREEMLVLDRPPYALAATNPVEPVSLDHGVRWRAVYAPESLEMPGALDEIGELAERGERGRVLPGLPIKLAIADRRLALMPLDLNLDNAHAALIRESTLLDALLALFETYWERAVPIGSAPASGLSPDDHALLQLLASGLTDTAIARQLGLSTRTMRRRTRWLFDQLSASNRFQAGAQATRRGWLG